MKEKLRLLQMNSIILIHFHLNRHMFWTQQMSEKVYTPVAGLPQFSAKYLYDFSFKYSKDLQNR